MKISLGIAPATGLDSLTQCAFFKRLINHTVGNPPNDVYFSIWSQDSLSGIDLVVTKSTQESAQYCKEIANAIDDTWKNVINPNRRDIRHGYAITAARGGGAGHHLVV